MRGRIEAGRALRTRGTDEEGLFARPESPSRCTFPITALRVTPPSSAAIWLAESPSAQSFLSNSTRSSVQVIYFSLSESRCNGNAQAESNSLIGQPLQMPNPTRAMELRNFVQ